MKVQDLLEALMLVEGEAPESFELKDIVKNFPSKYNKMIEALWGKDKLTYKGQKLFVNDDYGPVYSGAMKAAEKLLKKYRVEMELPEPTSGGFEYMTIDMGIDDDPQEVYLGYDPKTDKLYIGYDVWYSESDYNDAYQDFDPDEDKATEQGLDKAWKEFTKRKFNGVLLELDTDDGIHFKAKVEENHIGGLIEGGFYKGVYKSVKSDLRLVDLRLD